MYVKCENTKNKKNKTLTYATICMDYLNSMNTVSFTTICSFNIYAHNFMFSSLLLLLLFFLHCDPRALARASLIQYILLFYIFIYFHAFV